jgi:hypothetical protein
MNSSSAKRTFDASLVSCVVALFTFLGYSASAFATTIVVIRTPLEVIVATDSQGTFEGNGGPANTKPVCKIYEGTNGTFFAASGIINDPISSFSISDLVMQGSQGSLKISDKAKHVGEVIEKALLKELPPLQARDPVGYEKMVKDKSAVAVVFVGLEGPSPIAVGFSIGLTISPQGTIQTHLNTDSCPGSCPGGTKLFWLGESDLIKKLISEHKMPAMEPAALARFLVQVEIDGGVAGVGGPIDVLRITSNGPSWIQRKPGCPLAAKSPR